jgi:hypothetical protein
LEEESGYPVEHLEKIGVIVPCPAIPRSICTFSMRSSAATTPNAQRPDFDENLEPVAMTAAAINAAIDSGELID